MTAEVGLYRPRRTPLHAMPAWLKVLGLACAAVALVVVRDPVVALAALAGACLVLASTRPAARPTLRTLGVVAVFAAFAGAYHWWRGDIRAGVDLAADFVTLVALALAVSTSTRVDESMALVSGAARPLRRWTPPEALGLVFGLAIRAIPEVSRVLDDARDAARARGVERDPRAILTPAAVRTVGYALAVGDAITARGLAEEARP